MNIKQAASILGKKGGKETKRKYGKLHYQKLAANMNAVKKSKRETVDKAAK